MKTKKSPVGRNQPHFSPVNGDDDAEFAAWWAKYGPVERAIMSARSRRRANAAKKRRRREREFMGICELTEGRAAAWRREGLGEGEEFLLTLFRDAGLFHYLAWRRRYASRQVERLRQAVRRPLYYAAENARRRALAAERRKVRARRTTNPCPTKEQLLDAWLMRRKSHEDAIRFGSLVEDLECYLDNSLVRDADGVIVGRRPGVKGWLKENIPALALQYTTVMRYKAAARKVKQISGMSDPTPVDAILPAGGAAGDVPVVEVVRARAIWEEVSGGASRSTTSLLARIDALVDPLRIDDANMLASWRERYENEITERTKKRWWLRRLWKRTG